MRQTVYTSFDGDDMIYIDLFREFVIANMKIPLNPTHALGYYLSTIKHNNIKKNAMQDCCTIELLCDEFWIFTDTDFADFNNLSEGILIELLIWIKNKNSQIRVFDKRKVLEAIKKRSTSYKGIQLNITEKYLQENMDPEYINDLKRHIPAFQNLRKAVYIDIETEKIKYVDWAKAFAFENNYVPLVPQCVIPQYLYEIYDITEHYKSDLELLKNRISDTWIIRKQHVLPEGDSTTSLLTMTDIKVPKYSTPEIWAMTNKERIEGSV